MNGVSQGIQGIVSATAGGDSFATFSGLEFAPGNLTALARSMNSTSARVSLIIKNTWMDGFSTCSLRVENLPCDAMMLSEHLSDRRVVCL